VVSKWDDKVTGTGMQEDTHVLTIGVLVTNVVAYQYCIGHAGDCQAGDGGVGGGRDRRQF
jgi:hypothetical protein